MAKQQIRRFHQTNSLTFRKRSFSMKNTVNCLKIKTISFPIKITDNALVINDKKTAKLFRQHLFQV